MHNLKTMLYPALCLMFCMFFSAGCETLFVIPDPPRKGPPAHAPAHGHRAKKVRYYYYPDVQVYYNPETGLYHWADYGTWKSGKALPRRIQINSTGRRVVELDSDKPGAHHHHVHKKHPGKKPKKAPKYKGKNLKLY